MPYYDRDIFIYLYCDNNNRLDIQRYPIYITKIDKNLKIQKKNFENHIKTFFLDENNQLYKKVKIIKKHQYVPKIIQITLNKQTYVLLKIPQVLDILEFIEKLYIEDNHRGINNSFFFVIESFGNLVLSVPLVITSFSKGFFFEEVLLVL